MSAAKIRSCSCWSVAAAMARGPFCSGTGTVSSPRTARLDELTQQRTLVAEVSVDGLRRDMRLRSDAGDARSLVSALLEQLRGGGEHQGSRLVGLLSPSLRVVTAAGMLGVRHIGNSDVVTITLILYPK